MTIPNIADAVGVPATNWDMPGIIFLKLLAVVFLVLLNGFFVASEFAIVKVRASQLDALAAPSNGRARLARQLTSHLDAYLSATQLGITLASLGLGWLGEPFLADMIEPFFAFANITSPVLIDTVSFALAFGTITTLHIVLGELAPRSLFAKPCRRPCGLARRCGFSISSSSRPSGCSMDSLIACSNACSTSTLSPKASWSTASKNCG